LSIKKFVYIILSTCGAIIILISDLRGVQNLVGIRPTMPCYH